MEKKLISTSEVANLLGISRQAVAKKIKMGDIKAQKIGRNFVIDKKDLGGVLRRTLSPERKRVIEKSVDKTINEYGETLKLLGQE